MGQKTNPNEINDRDPHGLDMLNHELGNVLNGLCGMAGQLRNTGLSVEQERWLGVIEQSGQQMKRLIEQSGTLSSGRYRVPNPRTVRLDGIEFLEQVVTGHYPSAQSNGNRLILQAGSDLPLAWEVDHCLLRQLLDNLLGNAIKFTRGGDVVLRVTVEQGAVDTALVLTVRDTGPGIDAGQEQRVFRAYRRLEEHHHTVLPGQGLGLYICRQIVHAMGGEIELSRPGSGGARFRVWLPGVPQLHKTPLPGMAALSNIHCRLQLDTVLHQSVSGFLDRLEVAWSDTDDATPLSGPLLLLTVSEADASTGLQGLMLEPATPTAGISASPQLLPAPVLESTLGLALLQIVLESRWQALSSCGRTG